jgi:hypothetical protein
VVHEALGELELARGLTVGVGHQRAEGSLIQLALDGAHELLVPEVREAADEEPDDGSLAAGERAGDRVRLVAELLGRTAHARLGLGGDVHATQGVAHRGRRQARVLGELADRGALPASRGHRSGSVLRGARGVDEFSVAAYG